MDKIKVQLLREHPRNKEFFDDIEGECWKDFVESIKTSGIIVPLVVTRDYTVVSGNQRLRAAKELGLEEVPCEVKTYEEKNGISKEDWILKDLIETNLRQRGIGNLNPMKTAKCIIELERIYGVKKGGYRGDLQNLRSRFNICTSVISQQSLSRKTTKIVFCLPKSIFLKDILYSIPPQQNSQIWGQNVRLRGILY